MYKQGYVDTYFCLDVSVQAFQVADLLAGYLQLCSRIWTVGWRKN